MNPLREPPKRYDVVTIPIIWVAIVLSILVHLAALWVWAPRFRPHETASSEQSTTRTLAVQLTPPASKVASAAVAAPPPPQAALPEPRAAVRLARERPVRPRPAAPKRPAPPVIAIEKPAQRPLAPAPITEPTPAPAAKPATMPPAPATDLAAYVDARRRERGETSTPSPASAVNGAAESDLERRDRIVASNLGLNRTPTFGRDARNAGGMFEITELGYDDAQFYFLGYDKDIARTAKQLIEVRKGENSDIRIAVVRKMIAIIRENVTGDFTWVSRRLGRQVRLSARPDDNAGLEDFIMRDVFPDPHVP
ncbi:MAG TPA: hypothetical protein VIF33_05005 [Casimicrobiaceae bacterium]|jgi:hypothetical protein